MCLLLASALILVAGHLPIFLASSCCWRCTRQQMQDLHIARQTVVKQDGPIFRSSKTNNLQLACKAVRNIPNLCSPMQMRQDLSPFAAAMQTRAADLCTLEQQIPHSSDIPFITVVQAPSKLTCDPSVLRCALPLGFCGGLGLRTGLRPPTLPGWLPAGNPCKFLLPACLLEDLAGIQSPSSSPGSSAVSAPFLCSG